MAALLSWIVVATLLDMLLRHAIAGYRAAELTRTFTGGMMLARLALAAASSLAAGAVAARVAPADARPAWIAGLLLLAMFLPEHVKIWHSLPVWYHLTFLVTLVPLVALGARLARRPAPPTATVTGSTAD
ncbi:MAG: hypothetical protein JSR36_00580 [Proteobacteria bacterium]|nr:hypothetical protein [Pseudomonadota bacterium]